MFAFFMKLLSWPHAIDDCIIMLKKVNTNARTGWTFTFNVFKKLLIKMCIHEYRYINNQHLVPWCVSQQKLSVWFRQVLHSAGAKASHTEFLMELNRAQASRRPAPYSDATRRSMSHCKATSVNMYTNIVNSYFYYTRNALSINCMLLNASDRQFNYETVEQQRSVRLTIKKQNSTLEAINIWPCYFYIKCLLLWLKYLF